VLDAVRLTVKLGVDVNAADEDGDTALHRAVKLRFNSVIEFLVEQGARLDVRNTFGQTPLMIAATAAAGASTADLLRRLGAKE
jgi:ankyrin repeat protein